MNVRTDAPNQITASGSGSVVNQKASINKVFIASVVGAITAVGTLFKALSYGITNPIASAVAIVTGGITAVIVYLFISIKGNQAPLPLPSQNEPLEEKNQKTNAVAQSLQSQQAQAKKVMQEREQKTITELGQSILKLEEERDELAKNYEQAKTEYKCLPFDQGMQNAFKELQDGFENQNKQLDELMKQVFKFHTERYNGTVTREKILQPYREKYSALL